MKRTVAPWQSKFVFWKLVWFQIAVKLKHKPAYSSEGVMYDFVYGMRCILSGKKREQRLRISDHWCIGFEGQGTRYPLNA